MLVSLPCLGLLLASGAGQVIEFGQHGTGPMLVHGPYGTLVHPYFSCPRPPAPDVCSGLGHYWTHPLGQTYGPSYNLVPPWPPFNGLLPIPKPCCGPMGFPTHPFARGPRDFFMMEP
ncbi:MAG: hypothetical protein NZ700_16170 [Gemmataceae bacterium]|nr:hypothetical protein [Gemmataceae bacterium]MDW8264235.1 hypothetical protein [Gemmataceae bacterium]